MELPTYHLPTVRGVLRRSSEQVWLFLKKIITVVAVVQIGVWFFVTFPGVSPAREAHYDRLLAEAKTELAAARDDETAPELYEKKIGELRREHNRERIVTSYAGQLGQALEPVSKLAGFEWRMNIAIIASFAAKESLVGTLGTIYSVEEEDDALAASIARAEHGWTVWHKLAMLVFIALFPPCLATIIVIGTETRSWRWALFATFYPIVLGFLFAVTIFQLGPVLFG